MDPDLVCLLPCLSPTKMADTSAPRDISHKVQNDPLNVLPFDVFYIICEYLEERDILKLVQASCHVHVLTRNNSFWKQMVHSKFVPWLWELNDMLSQYGLPANLDFKCMFLWLERVTRYENVSGSVVMGIANRKRIWNTCEQLYYMYNAKVDRRVPEAENHAEAKAIFDTTSNFHMPKTMNPDPGYADTVSAQLIRSWDDVSERPCDLKT
jgi:hypothetical protein